MSKDRRDIQRRLLRLALPRAPRGRLRPRPPQGDRLLQRRRLVQLVRTALRVRPRRGRVPRPGMRPPRRVLLGQARLVPAPGVAGTQGRDQVQARVRPRRGRPGGHGAVREGEAGAHGELLRVRRRRDVLPVREVRAHVHILAVHDHPDGPGGRAQEGER